MNSLGDIVTSTLSNTQKIVEMTEPQRRAFEIECDAYDADVSAAKVELVKLTTLMPSPGTEQDPGTRAAMYWDVLKGELSPENISRVCRSAMAGRVSSKPFLPLPSELVGYANTYFQRRDPVRQDPRLHKKRSQLLLAALEHRFLTKAEEINADTIRKQVTDQFRSLARELRKRNEMLDRLAEKPRAPIDHTKSPVISGSLKPHIDRIALKMAALEQEEAAE
jgi:hypothetical protein